MRSDLYGRRLAAWEYYFPRLRARRAPSEGELAEFEAELGGPLPDDYRAFLALFGGAAAGSARLAFPVADPDWRAGAATLRQFYGFTVDGVGDVRRERAGFGDRLPPGTVPIAECPNGDQLCLAVAGPDRGAVLLWSQDFPRETAAAHDDAPWADCVYRVAPSFAAFFEAIAAQGESGLLDETAPGDATVEAAVRRSEAIEAQLDDERNQLRELQGLLKGFRFFEPSGWIYPTDDHAAVVLLARLRKRAWEGVREWLVEHGRAGAPVEEMEASLRRWLAGEADEHAAPVVPPSLRRVRHKAFGEGTVVREIAGGKLEVQFDGAGTKVMLARFVDPVG